ncbi:Tripartite tricarboxylate transporter TctB family protein [Paracoccus haematequi]|uniref:Tripartite tricarboxylate transporter TctB family protein n=1 Tax=Paracoccus haematequi TaxID=2491866 RepID=A0A3S4DWZ0_9RHOB|nr:tripartite tricarboxylate transporter TctB family protein [Paracoccus haematequi]VDS09226.1 Tripartite tricarboxylate transporter TctB family protein [Paracoccus haematequi]
MSQDTAEVIQVDVPPGHPTSPAPPPSNPWLGRERIAGLSLVAFGLFALYAGADLPFRSESGVGSGMLPRALSIILIVLGAVQLAVTWKDRPESTGRWPIRDMLPVLIGVFLFAITIRGHHFGSFEVPTLGMAVATPLAVILSGLAAKDVRLGELVIFAAILTAVCIGLFRYALGLSLPVAPWLIGY